MFGGGNGTPVFPVLLDENQLQYDPNGSTQLQLFGTAGVNRSSKRGRETEAISRQQKLHFSLNNFAHDEVDRSGSIPNSNAVSTGLRLSYDDDEPNSSVTSASGSMTTLPVISSLGDSLRAELDRQKEEFDHYIRVQEEHITKGVKEMKQRQMASLLSTIEKEVGRKLREKEVEIDNMNRKNRELVEKIKEVALEAQSWHQRARYNEAMVNSLRSNLEHAIAQGTDHGKEGCGDSEVDDSASSYNQNMIAGVPTRMLLENRELKEQRNCKICKSKEISILLWPCRHLCICKDCEGSLDVCPVCQTMKTASVEVYMS
ncbi:unnamed protein product [Victoria cruziana]